ncbi:predicted protein [Nematostella vectensis]|uniref:Fibrinogen C-terminal domain-containing protein n=2 Tax=Nematostella vectensis TaxID=45351 RepID=A7RQ34_NEMVE|nr:predicted protein [Nematostella vectensis]|eukprot:XP_001638554.1 predicted protein [Nematostella vectensis]
MARAPVCRKEDCSPYDIGLVFDKIASYSPQDKLKFIENVWKPVKLQSKAMDILKAKGELALLISVLTEMSNDIDATHHELYQDAVTIARQVDVQPDKPRVAQTHRPNAPASNPEDYYKINLTRVFLDHVLEQLDSRFKDDVFICYKEVQTLDFTRTFEEYGVGIGTPGDDNFMLGLDNINSQGAKKLLVRLEDWDGNVRFAEYDNFAVGSKAQKYTLALQYNTI